MNAPTPEKVLAKQVRNVYRAINAVQAELCKTGISKDSRNTQGAGYNFRGIDAVYNALSPIMAANGLVILPRMLSRTCEERQSKSGGALFYVVVEAEFDFVAVDDGSVHTVKTYGEAMDSSDKATNKAMSAAYKYAAFQAFAIPTQGDNDADSHTHEVEVKKHLPPVKAAMQSVQIDPESEPVLRELAAELVQIVEVEGNPAAAYNRLIEMGVEGDEKLYLWDLLAANSKTRSALKKEGQNRRLGEQA